jgi:hypothetical protein
MRPNLLYVGGMHLHLSERDPALHPADDDPAIIIPAGGDESTRGGIPQSASSPGTTREYAGAFQQACASG